MEDFDTSTLTSTFAADEGSFRQTDLFTPIPIVDDEIDEDDDQVFLVQLILIDATNRDLITLDRAVSNCIIVDNDREYLFND